MTADTRWLTESEQDLWRHILASIRKINRGMEETLLACGDISAAEFSVLVSLSEAPAHTRRLRELCTELEWDRSRASHQITRMEKRGLVRKEKCAGDARGVEVVMTKSGRERLEAAVPEHVESVRRMVFDHLDPADAPAVLRFCEGVLSESNLPGYDGFVPDERLGIHTD
ncbi:MULTISPECIES: MarR family winged helix-turn-helix transcriptional regulator [Corynebacterium]|uniref:MarR family transcriptional regulator n=1 Tax=Corynebacterium intestinale TaxID=2943492 RepID=A0ABT0T6P7_9CORY|nr:MULTISPECIES: MarR family transcriptional regulator [Corynebacterium]MCG7259784.1 MarR family transcriptional regulator [Corynebacterium aurimucosum]MCL8492775.1 MarR family transcriptional regulator [Corynebacterium intestinale]MCP1389007.1 MarR family transcriptional regulator [Corynebacterium intestinale]MDK6807359.1 MarR family transcriptional regulator [Corynebacterium aurimucosum]MTD98301.1 MarR family transcriptional regulator [Corynebacterium guaraldiae]